MSETDLSSNIGTGELPFGKQGICSTPVSDEAGRAEKLLLDEVGTLNGIFSMLESRGVRAVMIAYCGMHGIQKTLAVNPLMEALPAVGRECIKVRLFESTAFGDAVVRRFRVDKEPVVSPWQQQFMTIVKRVFPEFSEFDSIESLVDSIQFGNLFDSESAMFAELARECDLADLLTGLEPDAYADFEGLCFSLAGALGMLRLINQINNNPGDTLRVVLMERGPIDTEVLEWGPYGADVDIIRVVYTAMDRILNQRYPDYSKATEIRNGKGQLPKYIFLEQVCVADPEPGQAEVTASGNPLTLGQRFSQLGTAILALASMRNLVAIDLSYPSGSPIADQYRLVFMVKVLKQELLRLGVLGGINEPVVDLSLETVLQDFAVSIGIELDIISRLKAVRILHCGPNLEVVPSMFNVPI